MSNVKKFINLKTKGISIGLFLLINQQVFAVGLSTYRIKLDNADPETEFIVFNKSVIAQKCSINLIDIIFNESGEKIQYQGSGQPDISAKKHLKYSPRNFEIKGNDSQSVRFKYRRKRTATPQELRSYLSLMCDNVIGDTPSDMQITLSPKLRINIPIIVRTGDIPVEVTFSSIRYNNNTLTIEVAKTGGRSIYGYLEVVNKTSGDVIASQKAFSLHAEVTKTTHEFSLENLDLSNIDIVFREDNQLSGDISIRQSF